MGLFNRRTEKGISPLGSETPSPAAPSTGAKFEVVVDPAFYGLPANTPLAVSSRITRRAAMQLPALKRGRDLVAGTVGALPCYKYNADLERVPSDFLAQPLEAMTAVEAYTLLAEDLMFEGIAWWKITAFDWQGYPAKAVRLEPRSVSIDKAGRVVVTKEGNQGETRYYVDDSEIIRFGSPNDALLVVGARAITTALRLDAAASRYSEGLPPLDWFTPTGGADPADDEDVADMLTKWQTARQTRSTAYVPAALEYHSNTGFSPEQLQMASARDFCITEIARLIGVDSEDLGVSTTSRTYFNAQDRYQARLKDTLRPYLACIEQRLSMGDVTPRGYTVRFDISDLLRTDDASRYAAYSAGLAVGAITPEEIRDQEHKAPLTPEQQAAISAPAPAPTPEVVK